MSENLRNIDRRINDFWSKGQYVEACRIVATELVPILRDNLISSKGLRNEDAEDAVADAYQGFLKKISKEGPQSISAPKPYIWKSALMRGIDYKKRSRTAEIPESQLAPRNQEGDQPAPHTYLDSQLHNTVANSLIPVWQIRATLLMEALIDDIEITASDAEIIVRETIKRLAAPNAEILNQLLQYGADQAASDGARLLGITAINFGVRKHRAYKEFREVVVQVRTELGIQWRGLPEEQPHADAVDASDFVPSEDEAEDTE
jgi:DNA-directed RNA polymerase specialized sigma24 family protein